MIEVLGTKFTGTEMEVIYRYLGNACNHRKTMEFVQKGFDMEVLK